MYELFFNSLLLLGRHFFGVVLSTDSFYPLNTGITVRSEYQTEYSGYKIIKLTALHSLAKGCAVSTVIVGMLKAAAAYFAPGGFGVVVAARAGCFQEFTAGATIESAFGYQLVVGSYGFHVYTLVYLQNCSYDDDDILSERVIKLILKNIKSKAWILKMILVITEIFYVCCMCFNLLFMI